MDILFLSHNRREFTELCLNNLLQNTDWSQVETLYLYDDDSKDGTREVIESFDPPAPVERRFGRFGGPVDVMNHYLRNSQADVFAKIDSDTMVPKHWDTECLRVLHKHPELDLLGIEAFRPVQAGQVNRTYDEAQFIGGIGLMRKRCFRTLPKPDGRFGFTAWQQNTKDVVPGWLNPALPVFLLDHMPMEPYATLSQKYEKRGWQRKQWGAYKADQSHLWEWWKPPQTTAAML